MAAELRSILYRRPTLIWLVLVLASVTSWILGTNHGVDPELATTVVLVVAFIKVRLIGIHFMELNEAVLPLRVIFEAFCLLVGTAVIVLYYVG